MGQVNEYISGWDTTISIDGGGNGSAQLIDAYNSFMVVQLIASPSNPAQTYTIDILNQDFNLVAYSRSVQGPLNEFLTMPMVGRNVLRIQGASPATGTVVVAVRYK